MTINFFSKAGSKVFDKDRLKANEGYLLKESKLLGLSPDDLKEIEATSVISTDETASEVANFWNQINTVELKLEDYVEHVEQLKRLIQDIQSSKKELMELMNSNRIELDTVNRYWTREMVKTYFEILHNITSNMAMESTIVDQVVAVSAKIQVPKKSLP